MSQHVLLIGGHGKIAQLLTPLLLQKSFRVTSMIRAQEQVATIEKLGAAYPGKLDVLVHSIDDVDTEDKAKDVLNKVKPDFVAWSAGAGGKGGVERTFKVDRDAAIHFIKAAAATQTISRFLLVSYAGSRRKGASWWPANAWEEYDEKVNHGVLANYYKAKIDADEALYEVTLKSKSLYGICLRPGTLTDEKAGDVELGKTSTVKGSVSREAVAQVAAEILGSPQVKSTWLDLFDGKEGVKEAVERVIRDKVDAIEGEPITQGSGLS